MVPAVDLMLAYMMCIVLSVRVERNSTAGSQSAYSFLPNVVINLGC